MFLKEWIDNHPNIWEFIKFNILSNVATIVNFIVMWIATSAFTGFGWGCEKTLLSFFASPFLHLLCIVY